ncbi:MAG: hypothetical protein A2639_01380 [Candidatus Staskawiczbacteria bacterium RIFCSPHIGHO2_01_FULL_34_27]|uniref:2'-deoxynucleoside 5'-phosphate N-hydrolase 1 n=1 Tax=Candidatus Staskawiczbacteria bacterium RIFCSPHIGHO2_01_FULL_34_27 TaxID=1802199 RepID=A0A1G2HK80_9BACT|nr:MAG: hypothetical protein A2639_01380 [Candidatus Staskawiczbacteria bacterium RIFCSPHIGHO2_01_FULL_34_27]
MKKIVYFAGAIKGECIMKAVISELIKFVRDELGIVVLSEHVGEDDPNATLAEKIGKTKDSITPNDIEFQDTKWLDEATHVIAEVSGASTGTGIEIGHARQDNNKKILCIYKRDRWFLVTNMVKGMNSERWPNVLVKSYLDLNHAKTIVREFLDS